VAVREQVAFSPDQIPEALRDLLGSTGAEEAALLSTCNRTEIYCRLGDAADADEVCQWLETYRGIDAGTLRPYLYRYQEEQAVRHLMRVSSGLDSMVLGEPQILGQVKTAYRTACGSGAMGGVLDRLFRDTFKVAKRVRTETEIGTSPVSIASAAGGLAVQEFCKHSARAALLIGAGETMELVARHLVKKALKRVVVANRTLANAQRLAQLLNGEACELARMDDYLTEVDVVVSSTASPGPILDAQQVAAAMAARGNRPLVIVDLAVPRDVDPAVATTDHVSLYSIDDLRRVTEENWRYRCGAAAKAEDIIHCHAGQFMAWLGVLDVVPTIRDYRDRAQQSRDEVLKRARRQLAQGVAPDAVLSYLADTLTNKLLHPATASLRQAGMRGDTELLSAAQRLLGIEELATQSDENPESESGATVYKIPRCS
jgi:glutamyl-tRNA reductase